MVLAGLPTLTRIWLPRIAILEVRPTFFSAPSGIVLNTFDWDFLIVLFFEPNVAPGY